MPKKARDVIGGLEKKGFRIFNKDHVFLHLWVDDRKTAIFTKVSHGEREIDDRLLRMMARQTNLSKKLFEDLIDCPLSEEEYIRLMRKRNHID